VVRRAAILLAASALALVLAGCGSEGDPSTKITSDTLTIYTSLPLRGTQAGVGRAVLRGEKLALAEVGGRVGDLDIGLIALDDTKTSTGEWDGRQVAANARIAAENPSTIAYIGDLDSGASAISIPIANEIGVLQVSPLSGYAGLTQPGDKGEPSKYYPSGERTFARLVPDGVQEARALAALIRSEGITRVAIAHDGRQEGLGYGLELERGLRAGGVAVTGMTRVEPDQDPASAAEDLAADPAPAVVYAGASVPTAAALLSAVAREAPAKELFATSGTGPALAGALDGTRVRMTSPLLPLSARPAAARRFAARYAERFGATPPPAALFGYEAMRGVLDAISRAGEDGNDRRAVIEAYFATQTENSVLGGYAIDKDGDVTEGAIGAFAVADGRLRFQGVLD
jgi:branched-chain amino acid transport system substrate-binding protein